MNLALARSWAIWFVVLPTVHGAMPWAISSLTPKWGWKANVPAYGNLLGLIVIGAAAALVIYAFWWRRQPVYAIPPASKTTPDNLTGAHLMRNGPYGVTRNPVYLGYLGLWLGWSIFFGSIAVFAGLVVLCMIATKVIVPAEERMLAAQFGDDYVIYRSQVPRWLGNPTR